MKQVKGLNRSRDGNVRPRKGLHRLKPLGGSLQYSLEERCSFKSRSKTSPSLTSRKKTCKMCRSFLEYVNQGIEAQKTCCIHSVSSFCNTASSFTSSPVVNCSMVYAGSFLLAWLQLLLLVQQCRHEPSTGNPSRQRTHR